MPFVAQMLSPFGLFDNAEGGCRPRKTEQIEANEDESVATASSSGEDDVLRPSTKQQQAASELAKSVGELLRVGVANAGVVVQSGLLALFINVEPKGCTVRPRLVYA